MMPLINRPVEFAVNSRDSENEWYHYHSMTNSSRGANKIVAYPPYPKAGFSRKGKEEIHHSQI